MRADCSQLPFCGFKRLQELSLRSEFLYGSNNWGTRLFRSTQLHRLQKLDIYTGDEGLSDIIFNYFLDCLQRMADLEEVNICPYLGNTLVERGLDVFAPFSLLSRSVCLLACTLETNGKALPPSPPPPRAGPSIYPHAYMRFPHTLSLS